MTNKKSKLKIKIVEHDLTKEMTDSLVEKGKQSNNALTYEEIIEFSTQNGLSEDDTNKLFRALEKEHVELILQEELNNSSTSIEEYMDSIETSKMKFKEQFRSTFEITEEEDDETEKEQVKEFTDTSQISDSVKCYLRDIGKIPLNMY